MSTATVTLWGTVVGYVSMDPDETFARFQYDKDFVAMGVELSPLAMPLDANQIYQFRTLHPQSFHGLPGLLSDSLPDKYGNRLIDIWLTRTGRRASDFNAVDRLCYVGSRGMGALEYEPTIAPRAHRAQALQVEQLVELASLAFADKETLQARLDANMSDDDLLSLVSVGTSAGGARAKAVLAFNPETSEVRSGQLDLPPGFEHWLIKFDGVQNSGDWGIADPAGYGLLEFTYYQMAKACDIEMMPCRVFKENGRSHFMTRRFDRGDQGDKHFMQTFAALKHADYYETGAYSYEQIIEAMRDLGMSAPMLEQMVRRAIFNVVSCNQDDHVKNFSFMMDRQGQWSLSPAYDLCHAEGSDFTRHHQLSINGKLNDFTRSDLKALANFAGLPRGREKAILEQVVEAFRGWRELADREGVPERLITHVTSTLRLNW